MSNWSLRQQPGGTRTGTVTVIKWGMKIKERYRSRENNARKIPQIFYLFVGDSRASRWLTQQGVKKVQILVPGSQFAKIGCHQLHQLPPHTWALRLQQLAAWLHLKPTIICSNCFINLHCTFSDNICVHQHWNTTFPRYDVWQFQIKIRHCPESAGRDHFVAKKYLFLGVHLSTFRPLFCM